MQIESGSVEKFRVRIKQNDLDPLDPDLQHWFSKDNRMYQPALYVHYAIIELFNDLRTKEASLQSGLKITVHLCS